MDPLLLASAVPDNADPFWPWLRNLAVLAVLIYYVLGAWRKLKPSTAATISPQPLIVELQKQFVTKTELDEVEESLRTEIKEVEVKLENLDERIGESQTEIIAKGEERAVALHKRLDNFQQHANDQFQTVSGKLGELVGQLKQMNR